LTFSVSVWDGPEPCAADDDCVGFGVADAEGYGNEVDGGHAVGLPCAAGGASGTCVKVGHDVKSKDRIALEQGTPSC
jgi:hypothetical protein